MKNKSIFIVIAIILIIFIAIILYKNITNVEQEEDNNFKIVTTFYPIYIMTENITAGAQKVELTNMTDTNVGCLHDYTLVTADMKKIENADIIVQNGMGLENFMAQILSTYSNIKTIDSSKNVQNKIEENSHIWMNIQNYIAQVEEIAKGLSEANLENSLIYEQNKNEYIEKLKNIQEKYSLELSNLNGRKAICLDEALEYIAKQVGLDTISIKTDHEESTISAETMKNLIETMKSQNINIILVESGDNLNNAQTLANETGAKIYTLNSGLTGELNKDAYINVLNQNLEELKAIQ